MSDQTAQSAEREGRHDDAGNGHRNGDTLPSPEPTSVFVARQPIFGRDLSTYGYELLHRTGLTNNSFSGIDGTSATAQLIANTYLSIGSTQILGEKRAFINFDRNLLVGEYPLVFPPNAVVIEILESVTPDAEVIQACQKLRARGYMLALDDFVGSAELEPLTRLASIIKVDLLATERAEQTRLLSEYGRRGVKMLAEKVETQGAYDEARKMGFEYFQGYFFARPTIVQGREVPGFQRHYLRVLQEISRPELSYQSIEDVVKRETSMCYKLLRYINSSLFGWRTHIESIGHALALLGESEIRKWMSLVVLSGMADRKPKETVVHALHRARFCELLASVSGMTSRKSELFLMGMFSLLDAIIDQSLETALAEIHLADDIRDVLLMRAPADWPVSSIYAMVLAYESADWEGVSAAAARLGIAETVVPQLYLDTSNWVSQVFQG